MIVNYATRREAADRTVDAITAAGGRAVSVQGDVSKVEEVRKLLDVAEAAFGTPDIVVNNAGVFSFGPIETVAQAEIERQFATNVFGSLFVIQEAVRRFGPGGGTIINMNSIGNQNTAPNMALYSATKGAIDAITLGLSRELGARNIRVNSIAPGSSRPRVWPRSASAREWRPRSSRGRRSAAPARRTTSPRSPSSSPLTLQHS